MIPITLMGIVLVVLGVIALTYHGITYTTREEEHFRIKYSEFNPACFLFNNFLLEGQLGVTVLWRER